MSDWSAGQIIAVSVLALIAVYLVPRLIAAAIYKSKHQFEKGKHHE